MEKRDRSCFEAPGTVPGPRFVLGEFVTVAPRKHPGFNKEGGAGKITKVNYEGGSESQKYPLLKDGSEGMFLKPSQQRAISGITIGGLRTTDYTYNVKYVLGGSEKRVDAQWIQSKDPLKVNREELLAKRAKVTQQRKEEKAEIERKKEEERQRMIEERKRKRAEARASSLAMVKKIREKLQAEKRRGKQNKTAKSVTRKKPKQQRNPLAPTQRPNILTENIRQEQKKSTKDTSSMTSEPTPQMLKAVKILTKSIARIEKEERTGEIELEKLKDDLTKQGEEYLATNESLIESAIQYLQDENRIMYRAEVIWII